MKFDKAVVDNISDSESHTIKLWVQGKIGKLKVELNAKLVKTL